MAMFTVNTATGEIKVITARPTGSITFNSRRPTGDYFYEQNTGITRNPAGV
jgi:hypothetical protein